MGIYDRDYVRSGGGGPGGAPLSAKLRRLSVVQWLIIINIGVFMIDALTPPRNWLVVHMGDAYVEGYDYRARNQIQPPKPSSVPPGTQQVLPILDRSTKQKVGQRYYRSMPPLQAIGHFSTAKAFFQIEVWRFITFQFLHAGVDHLLFNMLGLWFFGPLVEQTLRTGKRFLSFYLICGMAGAATYLALNLLGYMVGSPVRFLLFEQIYTPLIGASAGVFGVLLACAHIAGSATMLFMLILPMRVSTGAYILFFAALANLIFGGRNAGGDAAHVGGALAGAFFIRKPQLLHEFFDVLKRSTPATKAPGVRAARHAAGVSQERIDAILEKVHRSGLHSLSEAEKKLLNRATRERRDPS